ncbi:hypothetical protein EJ06DRAFT_145410 [Trichodelitschia bisporula]|uniref:N-acetyltransferase domain-containing protein n=1 Tax=Trichodelitschia bisporula TaxID=703511 RepID=A0A6G1HNA9_9PEZI|nr:hypothetical protein EJ06DRAFT_145410 [Trichodelitschia bisporula]
MNPPFPSHPPRKPATMPLELHLLTPADCPTWVTLHHAAFQPSPLHICWAPGPMSPQSIALQASHRAAALAAPYSFAYKVTDSDKSNLIVGIAQWSIFTRPRSQSEITSSLQMRPPFPGDNTPARAEFMSGIFASRRKWIGDGRPIVILESLVVRAEYQRRGVGSMLVEWGCGEMDRLGVEGYLESSSAGRKLYAKYGFEGVEELGFDARRWGASEGDVHLTMIRQPRRVEKREEGREGKAEAGQSGTGGENVG